VTEISAGDDADQVVVAPHVEEVVENHRSEYPSSWIEARPLAKGSLRSHVAGMKGTDNAISNGLTISADGFRRVIGAEQEDTQEKAHQDFLTLVKELARSSSNVDSWNGRLAEDATEAADRAARDAQRSMESNAHTQRLLELSTVICHDRVDFQQGVLARESTASLLTATRSTGRAADGADEAMTSDEITRYLLLHALDVTAGNVEGAISFLADMDFESEWREWARNAVPNDLPQMMSSMPDLESVKGHYYSFYWNEARRLAEIQREREESHGSLEPHPDSVHWHVWQARLQEERWRAEGHGPVMRALGAALLPGSTNGSPWNLENALQAMNGFAAAGNVYSRPRPHNPGAFQTAFEAPRQKEKVARTFNEFQTMMAGKFTGKDHQREAGRAWTAYSARHRIYPKNAIRTWNEFQQRTAGQYETRRIAAYWWAYYKIGLRLKELNDAATVD
jgi:hypothetical protein